MQIHLIAMALVIALGRYLHLLRFEWALLFICFGLVIGLELINSSIEKVLDHLHPEKHESVGRAKDMAAAAVLFASLCSVVVAIFVFYQRISALINS